MTFMLRIALLSSLVLVALAAPASAIVPPKNCGYVKVGSKRYQIKADISCTTAKRAAIRYIRTRQEPARYNCKRYSASQTSIYAQCRSTSDRVILIIRK